MITGGTHISGTFQTVHSWRCFVYFCFLFPWSNLDIQWNGWSYDHPLGPNVTDFRPLGRVMIWMKKNNQQNGWIKKIIEHTIDKLKISVIDCIYFGNRQVPLERTWRERVPSPSRASVGSRSKSYGNSSRIQYGTRKIWTCHEISGGNINQAVLYVQNPLSRFPVHWWIVIIPNICGDFEPKEVFTCLGNGAKDFRSGFRPQFVVYLPLEIPYPTGSYMYLT